MVVAADAAHPVVQALVRWDPAWLAERELADRRELGFPPVTRMASLAGSPAALAEFLEALRLPEDADLLGPGARAAAAGPGGRARALPGAGAAQPRALALAARADRGAGRAQREEGRPSTCACSSTRSTWSETVITPAAPRRSQPRP